VLKNSIANTNRKIRPKDFILKFLIYFSAAVTTALLAAIFIYILVKGVPSISWKFLSTEPSNLKQTVGILPAIINTLYIVVLTLIIAVPIGIGSAIFLSEYAKKGKLVRLIEFTTETLSGIPSIVYGLFGAIFFGTILHLGYSLLTGALTLAIIVLPIIIRTTQEAMKTVPQIYREGALGMGATKWYMIRTIILPSSLPGIITSVILSIGRMVGESAALIFTAGIGAKLPKNILTHAMHSGATLTVQMYEYASRGVNYGQVYAIAVVLMVIVLCINTLTKYISSKMKKG